MFSKRRQTNDPHFKIITINGICIEYKYLGNWTDDKLLYSYAYV